MGRPNPNKSGRAKKKTLNKLKEGDARKQLKEGGCAQHTKGIGSTLKKNSQHGVRMMRNEYASIIYNGGKLNERTINIGLHRIVWNRKGLSTNLYINQDDITMMFLRNNQLGLGRTQHGTQTVGDKINSNWIQIEPRMASQ